ncbi:MAG: hypothetical protein M1830_008931 [Pleopsidium flavum]|nr:MAG: hypothetical protein M1830_008931 [Pleopsidium flavum]
MPTPSDDILHIPSVTEHHVERSTHTTCPPDIERLNVWRNQDEDVVASEDSTVETSHQQQPTPPANAENLGRTDTQDMRQTHTKQMDLDEDTSSAEAMSPLSLAPEIKESEQRLSPVLTSPAVAPHSSSSSSMRHEFSNIRLLPNATSSFLRAGSKFHGTQESDRQVYEVQVEIKHVDMNESFLCGYLRIQGLTEDHPTLTTYFEGEIIGTKHTFQTKHESWGATEKTDMQHWARFPAWRPLAKQAKKADFNYKNFAQRENIFMRWKEYFLVPDHRVRTISGASFEGFYYICFNQVLGTVSGIYFHAKSEKYQQLELTHVDDRGCYGAMEFR